MPKYGWTHECELLASHHWMPFRSFMHVINSCKYKSFSVKAQRELMRTTLENLPVTCPFDETIRFPDSHIYIDLHHSVPSRIMRQLTMAPDHSDRQTEKGRNVPDGIDIRAYSNFEDAKVAFYSSVDQLLDICGRFAIEDCHIFGIYIQLSFENQHDLVWTP